MTLPSRPQPTLPSSDIVQKHFEAMIRKYQGILLDRNTQDEFFACVSLTTSWAQHACHQKALSFHAAIKSPNYYREQARLNSGFNDNVRIRVTEAVNLHCEEELKKYEAAFSLCDSKKPLAENEKALKMAQTALIHKKDHLTEQYVRLEYIQLANIYPTLPIESACAFSYSATQILSERPWPEDMQSAIIPPAHHSTILSMNFHCPSVEYDKKIKNLDFSQVKEVGHTFGIYRGPYQTSTQKFDDAVIIYDCDMGTLAFNTPSAAEKFLRACHLPQTLESIQLEYHDADFRERAYFTCATVKARAPALINTPPLQMYADPVVHGTQVLNAALKTVFPRGFKSFVSPKTAANSYAYLQIADSSLAENTLEALAPLQATITYVDVQKGKDIKAYLVKVPAVIDVALLSNLLDINAEIIVQKLKEIARQFIESQIKSLAQDKSVNPADITKEQLLNIPDIKLFSFPNLQINTTEQKETQEAAGPDLVEMVLSCIQQAAVEMASDSCVLPAPL